LEVWHLSNGNSPNSSDGTYSGTSSLLISDGLLYFGTWRLTLQAWDVSTGAFIRSSNIEGSVAFSTPALANGVIYTSTTVGGTGGNLHLGGVTALNARTGSLLWNRTIGSIQYSSPAVADGVVFVGSDKVPILDPSLPQVEDGHNIYALDAATGAPIWSYATGGDVYSSPAVAYGVVYVGSNDGKVYAFGTSTAQIPLPTSSIAEFPIAAIVPLLTLLPLVAVKLFWKRKIKASKNALINISQRNIN
jgi:outer membrane protein assembly factor BamB